VTKISDLTAWLCCGVAGATK